MLGHLAPNQWESLLSNSGAQKCVNPLKFYTFWPKYDLEKRREWNKKHEHCIAVTGICFTEQNQNL